jgi:mitochondrial fission protein ELM1
MADEGRQDLPLIWALTDDRAGNAAQALGVAEALDLPFETRKLEYTAAAALPNFVMGASFGGLTASTRVNLTPPWPDVVIAAGRRSAPVARRIKELSGRRAFLVQVMHPGEGVEDFDMIAVPRHDQVAPADNIFVVTGAPHRVTAVRLAREAERWRDTFAPLPKPWIALIVGGSTKRRAFTEAMARELGAKADALAKAAGGSLLVTTSRRTGEAADALFAEVKPPASLYRWGDPGDNPYFGYLALADAIIVTGDSVSMCCEACASEGPVYIYAPPRSVGAKHARLHRELFEGGYARPLGDALEEWRHPPLNAADAVAKEVRRRLGL